VTVTVFTASQKQAYIYNVHQTTTPVGKYNIFSGEDTDKSTVQNSSKHVISSDFIFGKGA